MIQGWIIGMNGQEELSIQESIYDMNSRETIAFLAG